MKKRFLLLFVAVVALFTACGGSRSAEGLIEKYVQGFNDADASKIRDTYPDFYVKFYDGQITDSTLETMRKGYKETYGDDVKITYKIESKEKVSDEELAHANSTLKSKYNTNEEASECYSLKVVLTYSGSKKTEDTKWSLGYCNYGGTWYLVD